jgi:hypothetical protein
MWENFYLFSTQYLSGHGWANTQMSKFVLNSLELLWMKSSWIGWNFHVTVSIIQQRNIEKLNALCSAQMNYILHFYWVVLTPVWTINHLICDPLAQHLNSWSMSELCLFFVQNCGHKSHKPFYCRLLCTMSLFLWLLHCRKCSEPGSVYHWQKEMHKSGELKTKEELLSSQQSLVQYTGSLLKQLFVWAGRQVLSTSSPHEHDAALADKLIVTSLLQVRSQST